MRREKYVVELDTESMRRAMTDGAISMQTINKTNNDINNERIQNNINNDINNENSSNINKTQTKMSMKSSNDVSTDKHNVNSITRYFILPNNDSNTNSNLLSKNQSNQLYGSINSEYLPIQSIKRDFIMVYLRLFLTLFVGIAFALLCVYLSTFISFPSSLTLAEEDQPPYLYLSYKDNKNIIKISRRGSVIQLKTLWGNFAMSDLRGMTYANPQTSKGDLYVADSSKNSGILRFSDSCSRWSSMRKFIKEVVSSDTLGVEHTYSLSIDTSSNIIYASFQHTDLVLRFYLSDFSTVPTPVKIYETHFQVYSLLGNNATYKAPSHFYPGTFLQFGDVGTHKSKEQGVRAVLYVKHINGSLDSVWIANENMDAVFILSPSTGTLMRTLRIASPINLHVDYQCNCVFVGSKNKDKISDQGNVVAYNINDGKVLRRYSLLRMTHPTGIVSYKGVLYVADQHSSAIHSFNITTGRYIRLVMSTDDLNKAGVFDPELLSLTYC